VGGNLLTFAVFFGLAAVIGFVTFRLIRNKRKPASVRVVMWMAWLSTVTFGIDAISWVAIRPWMLGEDGAIPVSFVTAVDNHPSLNQASWQSLQQVHHAAGGGTLLVDFGGAREFLAYGFSPATTAALIATPALMSALGAYLSWLVYRLARSVIEGESFTTNIIRQVDRATIVVAIVAVVHEVVRIASINGIYAEITEGSVAIRSTDLDFTLLLVAVGIAAFGQLLKSGIALARETEGLI
jgi:hypothetical protein